MARFRCLLPPCPAGNALGVLGLMFASFESFAGYMANGQVPDEVSPASGGAACAWEWSGELLGLPVC